MAWAAFWAIFSQTHPVNNQHFGATFNSGKMMYQLWQTLCWATFRAIFPPTHRVTLRAKHFFGFVPLPA
jgi:hypothetical protein